MDRPPRLAVLTLRGLAHFVPDLLDALAADGRVEAREFAAAAEPATLSAALADALAWTDDPARDAVWFEFCWPPFPALIARTDFGGRRVLVRVHRIEAYGSEHAAAAPWHKVHDAVVVGADMAERLRRAAPTIAASTRVSVVPNGLPLARYAPRGVERDPFAVGWCGALTLHKNPNLALDILHRLRADDPRWRLRVATKGGEPVAADSFLHLARRLGLGEAVEIGRGLDAAAMAAWHAGNAVLLSTSVYESFGYAIAEAAASGCDLAVLDNAAAAEFWPAETLFGTVEEAAGLIRATRPERWRGHVARFSGARQADAVVRLLAAPRAGFRAAPYWEGRYAAGGHSGSGSSGRLAAHKAEVLNRLVAERGIATVLEHGCGDGRQLALARYPDYVGTDVSPTALALCRARFADDPAKRFLSTGATLPRAELGLSLDVVYHLVEDETFEAHMRALFDHASRYVAIYASDEERRAADPHVRHRRYSDWVARERPGWHRVLHLPNPHPFDPARPEETSFASFQVFAAA